MHKELSIIIVNTNSLDYIKKCMPSIYSGHLVDSFEVIVVDNASYDGSEQFLKENYPEVKFIQSSTNLGFTRGNNLGYSYASGRYLLFLNGDTEILGDAVQKMLETLRCSDKAAIVGPRLLNSDGTLQTSCVQAFPSVVGEFLDCEFLRNIFPNWHLWGVKALYQSDDKPVNVDVISGACLMMKRNAFEQVGLFDINYFVFSEDVSLCYMAKHAGWDVLYLNEARVIHHGGGSTSKKGQSKFSDVLKRQSLFTFMRKHYGFPHPFLYRMTTFFNALLRMLALGVLMVLNSKNRWSHRASLTKWKNILSWSLGFEKWAVELDQPVEMTVQRWNYVRGLQKN